jgi:hypothetical protein
MIWGYPTTTTVACGARSRIPATTAATCERMSSSCRVSSSDAPSLYRSEHGDPVGSDDRSWAHVPTSVANRLKSLPPMPIVTRSVSSVSASNCGGFVSPLVCWKPTIEALSAPLQLTSTSSVPGSAAATRAG